MIKTGIKWFDKPLNRLSIGWFMVGFGVGTFFGMMCVVLS